MNDKKRISEAIYLLPLDSAEIDRASAHLTDDLQDADLAFKLSDRPDEAWLYYYYRAYEIWYPQRRPQIIEHNILTLRCLPSLFPSERQIATNMMREANRLSAPVREGRNALEAANKIRQAAFKPLSSGKPRVARNDGEAELFYREGLYNENNIKKHLAQRAFNEAIRQIAEDMATETAA